jgi:hypothetical protein
MRCGDTGKLPLAIAAVAISALAAACQPASPPAAQAGQATASSPLYVTGGYENNGVTNEAWIEALPRPASSMNLPSRAGCADLKNWLHQHGGVDSGWSDINISMRTRASVKVTITSAESVIIRRLPALRQPNTLTCVPDPQSFVEQEESLNWPNVTPGFRIDDNHYLGTPWQPSHYQPGAYSFSLKPGGQELYGFAGFTSDCNCEWDVELSLTVNGSPERLLVEDGDVPFRTTPGPAYPDDSPRNAVWCAIGRAPSLVRPEAAQCPPPTTYEEKPVYQ